MVYYFILLIIHLTVFFILLIHFLGKMHNKKIDFLAEQEYLRQEQLLNQHVELMEMLQAIRTERK